MTVIKQATVDDILDVLHNEAKSVRRELVQYTRGVEYITGMREVDCVYISVTRGKVPANVEVIHNDEFFKWLGEIDPTGKLLEYFSPKLGRMATIFRDVDAKRHYVCDDSMYFSILRKVDLPTLHSRRSIDVAFRPLEMADRVIRSSPLGTHKSVSILSHRGDCELRIIVHSLPVLPIDWSSNPVPFIEWLRTIDEWTAEYFYRMFKIDAKMSLVREGHQYYVFHQGITYFLQSESID